MLIKPKGGIKCSEPHVVEYSQDLILYIKSKIIY